jgi:signal transduction histidine kinase
MPLDPLLTSLLQEQLPAAGTKKLQLRAALAEIHGWELFTDRVRLGRVIMNLLVNAIRYTPPGGCVTLTASWQDQAGERLLILGVADTGAGISAEEQESIFQPFERGRSSRGDSSGSGLGLAVVDQLVEELGLRREVSSEYGRGSSFRVLVPQRLLRFAPHLTPAGPDTPRP